MISRDAVEQTNLSKTQYLSGFRDIVKHGAVQYINRSGFLLSGRPWVRIPIGAPAAVMPLQTSGQKTTRLSFPVFAYSLRSQPANTAWCGPRARATHDYKFAGLPF